MSLTPQEKDLIMSMADGIVHTYKCLDLLAQRLGQFDLADNIDKIRCDWLDDMSIKYKSAKLIWEQDHDDKTTDT